MSSTIPSFDKFNQNVTFTTADGEISAYVDLASLDDFIFYLCELALGYGVQLGACIIMLTVTVILTRESKRRKPVFILNILSLLFGALRALFLALFALSPWVEIYRFASSDFDGLPRSAYTISVMGAFFPMVMTLTVNASLVLQAHTVCKLMSKRYYYPLTALSCIIYLLAAGFRFAQFVTNAKTILKGLSYANFQWLIKATLACETMAIWYYSLIFSGKLVWTVYTRRKLGFQSWGYMQCLAVMGCCTMVIPSIFTIFQFQTPDHFPEAGALVMTMVALLLPLSSLWASMATTEPSSVFNFSQLWASRRSSQRTSEMSPTPLASTTSSTTQPQCSSERKNSDIPLTSGVTASSYRPTTNARVQRDSIEMDLEAYGIRVDRSYNVRNGL